MKQFVEVDMTTSEIQASGEALIIELSHCRLLLPLTVPTLTLRDILPGVISGC